LTFSPLLVYFPLFFFELQSRKHRSLLGFIIGDGAWSACSQIRRGRVAGLQAEGRTKSPQSIHVSCTSRRRVEHQEPKVADPAKARRRDGLLPAARGRMAGGDLFQPWWWFFETKLQASSAKGADPAEALAVQGAACRRRRLRWRAGPAQRRSGKLLAGVR
jgi:hypothetical protein